MTSVAHEIHLSAAIFASLLVFFLLAAVIFHMMSIFYHSQLSCAYEHDKVKKVIIKSIGIDIGTRFCGLAHP